MQLRQLTAIAYIPLHFELRDTHMPYYQSPLADSLEYELSFNEYGRVLITTNPTSTYSIDNISQEYDLVTIPDLARSIRNQYSGRLSILYDRILRHRKIMKYKSDTLWNVNNNVPARSMKGILMCFEEHDNPGGRNTDFFYNPKITKFDVAIVGIPNQLYNQGMRAHQQWDEIKQHVAGGSNRCPVVAEVAKDMQLAYVSLAEYITSKYEG